MPGIAQRPGSIQRSGVATYARAFEVESASGISHWGLTRAADLDELKAMSACFDYFFNEVFNKVEAYQTIDNEDGTFQFKER